MYSGMRTILTIIIIECLAFDVGVLHPIDNVGIAILWMTFFLGAVFFMAAIDFDEHIKYCKSNH